MKQALIMAGLIAASLSVSAAAQGPGGHRGPGGPFGLFQSDANADGRLTRAEFDAAQKARFDEMDADRNGVATADERRALMESRREAAKAERFAALDTDKNGSLSQAELDQAGPRGPGARGDRPGGPPGRGPGRGPGLGGERGGDVTLAQFTERAGQMFSRVDADGDGVVTLAEVQAHRPKR